MKLEKGFAASVWAGTGRETVKVRDFDTLKREAESDNKLVIPEFSQVCETAQPIRIGNNTVIAGFAAPGPLAIKATSGQSPMILFENVSDSAVTGLHVWHQHQSNRGVDGIQVSENAHNILVALNSVLFANDEGITTYGGGPGPSIKTSDISFLYNLVCSLNVGHPKGKHAMGGMMNAKAVGNVTFHKNGFLFVRDRGPKAASQNGGRCDIDNNVTYGYENTAIHAGGDARVNIRCNHVVKMPNNGGKEEIDFDGAQVYLEGNNGGQQGNFTKMLSPFDGPLYDISTGLEAWEELIVNRGAGWAHTPLNEALFQHATNRTGGMINSVSDLGGYPTISREEVTHDIPEGKELEWLEAILVGDTAPPIEINLPPLIDAIEDVEATIEVGGTVRYPDIPLVYSDPDNDAVTVTAVSDNQDLIADSEIDVSGSEVLIWSVPSIEGEANITVTVSDGELEASTMFKVSFVNEIVDEMYKPMEITRKGTYKVFANGVQIGNHNEYKEAHETAFNHKGANPNDDVVIEQPNEEITYK